MIKISLLACVRECCRVCWARTISINSSTVVPNESMMLKDHIQVTASNCRQDDVCTATVTQLSLLSPRVKSLVLKFSRDGFDFKAGQWVDFFIPDSDHIGGFSIVSPPSLLQKHSEIKLAVKSSKWPPALWIHEQCKVGDSINIRIGGDFFYDPPAVGKIPDLIFIAGGVGINPICSILHHLADVIEDSPNTRHPDRISLLYSAQSQDELIFLNDILSLQERIPMLTCNLFVTRQSGPIPRVNMRRITDHDLQQVLGAIDTDNILVYLCGPPTMADSLMSRLKQLGVNKDRVMCEKWW